MLGSPTITVKGRNLLAKIVADNIPLTLSNIGLGDGLQEENEEVTILANEIMKKEIESCKYSEKEGQYYIRRVFTNADLEEGFYIREVGIYAIDPDEGEILYAYTNAGENGVDYFAPGKGKVIVKEIIEMATKFGNAENITVVIDPSIALVSEKEFEEYKNSNKVNTDNLQKQVTKNTTDLKDLANPNILINGDFRKPINQRNFSRRSYTGSNWAYGIDRWVIGILDSAGQSECVLNDGYISLKSKANDGCINIYQILENPHLYYGKTLTGSFKYRIVKGQPNSFNVSAYNNLVKNGAFFNSNTSENKLIADGEWHVYTFTYTVSGQKLEDNFTSLLIGIGSLVKNVSDEDYTWVKPTVDTQIDIEWVKLELGSKATPFIPRLYGEELALCHRYYEVTDPDTEFLGSRTDGEWFTFTYRYPVCKRTGATISFSHGGKTGVLHIFSESVASQLEATITKTNEKEVKWTMPVNTGNKFIGQGASAFGQIVADAEIY